MTLFKEYQYKATENKKLMNKEKWLGFLLFLISIILSDTSFIFANNATNHSKSNINSYKDSILITNSPFSMFGMAGPDCSGSNYIRYTPVAPAIDQTIDECWNAATSPGTFPNLTVGSSIPADFAGSQWRALYDENNLYVLFEIKDLTLVNNSSNWWEDDAVEIYIDGNNSKGTTYDGVDDFQWGFRYNDAVVHVGNNSLNRTTGIQFSIFSNSAGYNVEVKIPWSTIGAVPTHGYQIGFEVEVDDDDNIGGAARDAQMSAFDNTGTAWQHPNLFGTMTLCNGSPDVTITQAAGQLDPWGLTPINFTATFSEPVTGFTSGDVTLGGTAGASGVVVTSTGANTYNIAVSGMTTDGTVSVSIAAGVCTDAAGNFNNASFNTDNIVTRETIKPGVTITQAPGQQDPSNSASINFVATFTEGVFNFDASDITLSGTAGANNVVITGTGPYNFDVSGMTSDGTVIVTINAGVCNDIAGNLNTASVNADNSVVYDKSNPVVTITQAAGQLDPSGFTPINFTATFSEPVTGFTSGDVTIGGTAGASNVVITSTGANTYNIAVSGMTTDGTVSVSIAAGVCTDATGNFNNASVNSDNLVTYETVKPGVTITQAAGQQDPASISPINFTASFTENVINFDASDITLSGTAGANNVVVTGTGPYNLAISGMTSDGTVNVSINAGVCNDAAGNLNTASVNTDNSVTYDASQPGVTITQATGQLDPTNISTINFTATFTENVLNFDASDVTLSGTAGANNVVITGTGPYNLAVSGMTSDGTVIVTINAGLCNDVAGNLNTASVNTDNSVTYDVTKPGVTITQATGQQDPASISPINFTASFTESVINFDASDVTLSGTAGATNVVVTSTGANTYNIAVSGMTLTGTVLVTINAGVCTDATGNLNTASTNSDNSVAFDASKPGLTINLATGQDNPTINSVINFTVTFTENVTGFDMNDIILSGTANPTSAFVTGSGSVFNVAVSGMSVDGTVIIQINANVCIDLAGNFNSAATYVQNTVTFQNSPLTVSINQSGSQADPCNVLPIIFNVNYNRNITGFTFDDIIWTGTASGITGNVTGSGSSYVVSVTGISGDGTLIASIPSNKVQDALAQPNTGSTSLDNSVTYDITNPSPTISLATGQTTPTVGTVINFNLTFSEPVTGFDASDIILSGTAGASNVVISGTGPIYNAAVSGMVNDGTVIISINSGRCTDLAGNPNNQFINSGNTVDFQNSVLTVSINQNSSQKDPCNNLPIIFNVDFKRNVTGFTFDDIIWTGTASGITGNISGSGSNYTVNVTGIAQEGTLIATIPANKVLDQLAQNNTASVSIDNSVIYDITRPSIEILVDDGQNNPTNSSVIRFKVNLSEGVTDFKANFISISGGTGANTINLTGGPLNYIAEIRGMTTPGTVTINIPENMTTDIAGNLNLSSLNTGNTMNFDNVRPDVLISSVSPNPTSLTEIPIRIEFSKSITGFDETDINISNGSISNLSETKQGTQWDGYITQATEGMINVQIPAEAASDISTNYNNASNYFQIEYKSVENNNFEAANIFTPNSNFNRYWTIKNVDFYKDYNLVIKNGSGQTVFQTTNYQNNWNGTYNNKPLPTGTYYYFLSNQSKNMVFKGFVNIIYE